MKHHKSHSNKNVLLSLIIALICISSNAQEKELSWQALSAQYVFPEWFTEARFGIWVHWGAQSVPEYGGGWYARHMYQQDVGSQQFGKNAYAYHNKTYGHPSEKGFKDVIHQWKAEQLDTDNLLKYFTENLGAKYVMALANHHDHFDNFNSTHQPWNSVNVGPKRDIIGEFKKSADKYKIPFGVSSHDDRFLDWWRTAFGADTTGPLKSVPYDGHLTKTDGNGKWWEGLDPADLYGLAPHKRTPEWIEAMKDNWVLRHKELVIKYDVDMLWFDGYGFPYDEHGKAVSKAFYNHSLKKHGTIKAVVAGKIANEPAVLKDIERGVANDILSRPWQGTTTFTDWFYKKDKTSRHNARTVIEILIDMNSKNGNLLLNVELLPDGTIPPDHKVILDDIGAWVTLNGEAIYASKPWKVYGDNLYSSLKKPAYKNIDNADLEALEARSKKEKEEHYNNRTIESLAYGSEEVRFTTKEDVLYVFVLNPSDGMIELPTLGLNSAYATKEITAIRLIGSKADINFEQTGTELRLDVPANRPNNYAAVFEIIGAL